MTKKDGESHTQLILGILGFLGVVITSVLTIYAPVIQESLKQRDQPTAAPTQVFVITATNPPTAVPTDTVPPGDPTSTPAPATDTPEPTFTLIPPVALGQAWIAGCISSLWKPYPLSIEVTERNGCLLNPVYVFSANNGALSFLSNRKTSGGEEVYGLFAPLSESGTVTVHVRLRDLSNVDLWAGVFADQNLGAPGILMTIPAGNPKNRLVVQKDVSNYETIQTTQMISQGDGFIITFEFNPLSARALVNRNLLVTNPIPIPSAEKWLFLGYKGLSGSYRIDGEFFNLELK